VDGLLPRGRNLDYGNSPRATPLIDGGRVYLFGAFGQLTCAELATGKTLWDLNVRAEFDAADEPKWGNLFVAPLGRWQTYHEPRHERGLARRLGPRDRQDAVEVARQAGSLRLADGGHVRRQEADRWARRRFARRLGPGDRPPALDPRPGKPNDFNVPTPIPVGNKLLVTTENNGTRLYCFRDDGTIDPKPAAVNRRLAPDTHTPVVVGDRVFGTWRRLFCLSVGQGLKAMWDANDSAYERYCSAVASETRVLVVTLDGDLILIDAAAPAYRECGRLKAFADEKGLYSHPAFVGTRAYLRGSSSVVCLDLGPDEPGGRCLQP